MFGEFVKKLRLEQKFSQKYVAEHIGVSRPTYLQIEKGKGYVATDSDVLTVIARQVKTHKESIEMFGKAGRQELVDREQAELGILQSYLPKHL